MRKEFSIFIGFLAVSSAVFTTCRDKKIPIPKSVEIDGCKASDNKCNFYRGHNLKAVVEFTALSNLTWLIPQVNVTVDGVEAETTLPSKLYEACDWLEGKQQCPIPKGKDATWLLKIPIVWTDPLVDFSMEVSMIADDDQQQFCFTLKGKIDTK